LEITKEIAEYMAKRSLEIIENTMVGSIIKNKEMNILELRQMKEDWVADLAISILEASAAVGVVVNTTNIELNTAFKVKVGNISGGDISRDVELNLSGDDSVMNNLINAYHGGGISADDKSDPIIVSANIGLNQETIDAAADIMSIKLMEKLSKDEEVIKMAKNQQKKVKNGH